MVERDKHASAKMDDLPLCVDLDGTLLKSDLLIESLFGLLGKNLFYIFVIPIWLLRGKAHVKHELAMRTRIDVSTLPFRESLLDYIKFRREQGQPLILATSANEIFAKQVAQHLAVFDDVIASTRSRNLSGDAKAQVLIERYGEKAFDYAGNSRDDLIVWKSARHAIVVDAGSGISARALACASVTQTFDERPALLSDYLKAMRVHQWLKNFLVFVPLIAGHEITNLPLVFQSVLGFISFCLCASSAYLVNDFLDLRADRLHPSKRERPFAAGEVPLDKGLFLALVLIVIAFAIAFMLSTRFAAVLGAYCGITITYSIYFKNRIMIDVLVLASLYTFRIIAGSVATQIALSFWLLSFSMFLFLSLALIKRYTELYRLESLGHKIVPGRGYETVDLESLMSLGSASGYIAVLVLALYINSEDVRELYSFPEGIWLLCPLLLYWVSRLWLKARRGEVHDDPVVFATQDRASILVLLAGIVVLFLST